MGFKLLTATVGALVFIFAIDFFLDWYNRFLERFSMDDKMKLSVNRIFWTLMALLFWRALIHYGFPERFGMPFLLFTVFIYSLRGLILAAFSKNSTK